MTLFIIIGLVITVLVSAYFFIFEEWNWIRVIKWIICISVVIMPLALIDNYRIFMIAVMIAVIFEYKYLSRK